MHDQVIHLVRILMIPLFLYGVDAAAKPPNRIVGTFEALVQVGPCGGPFGPPFLSTSVFHAGGTISETNAAPLGGIPTPWGTSARGPGFGTWQYHPKSDSYEAWIRFNWYVGGFYHGYQQIHFPALVLSRNGETLTGGFTAARYFANGDPPAPNCGHTEQVRFP